MLRSKICLVEASNRRTARRRTPCIEVPGRSPLPLVDYLFEARNLVGELLETILHDVADAKAGRLYIPASNQLRERAEQGLGVILAPDGLLA